MPVEPEYGNEHIFTAVYSGPLSMDKFKSWWKSMNAADLKAQAEQMALKAQSDLLGSEITMYFSFGSYNLGTAFAQSGCTFSNFDPASVWIK